jgi:hypothetical protein
VTVTQKKADPKLIRLFFSSQAWKFGSALRAARKAELQTPDDFVCVPGGHGSQPSFSRESRFHLRLSFGRLFLEPLERGSAVLPTGRKVNFAERFLVLICEKPTLRTRATHTGISDQPELLAAEIRATQVNFAFDLRPVLMSSTFSDGQFVIRTRRVKDAGGSLLAMRIVHSARSRASMN